MSASASSNQIVTLKMEAASSSKTENKPIILRSVKSQETIPPATMETHQILILCFLLETVSQSMMDIFNRIKFTHGGILWGFLQKFQ
jgi:hypothetical protein